MPNVASFAVGIWKISPVTTVKINSIQPYQKSWRLRARDRLTGEAVQMNSGLRLKNPRIILHFHRWVFLSCGRSAGLPE